MEKYTENYNDLINEYLYISDPNKEITIDERISILISKLNSKNMEGINYIKYVIELGKILFDETERENNVGLTIVRDNELSEISNKPMVSAILSINKKDFNENPEYNLYYYLNSNTGILPISKTHLQDKFSKKNYEYLSIDHPKVPGIVASFEENKVF